MSTHRTLQRIRSSALVVLASLLVGAASPALAAMRSYTVRWNPSPTPGVAGYELAVGQSTGSYPVRIDLGLPGVSGGESSATVQIDDSADQHLSLRAYDASGLFSTFSNEIVVPAAGSPPSGGGGTPPPPPTSNEGVTSVTGLGGTVSGSVPVEAFVTSNVSSVAFLIDGVTHRVDNFWPWSLAGDRKATPLPWDSTVLADGTHTLTAVGYTQDDAAGTPGLSVTVTFQVQNGAPASPAPPPPTPDPDPDPGPGPDPDPNPEPDPEPGPEPGGEPIENGMTAPGEPTLIEP